MSTVGRNPPEGDRVVELGGGATGISSRVPVSTETLERIRKALKFPALNLAVGDSIPFAWVDWLGGCAELVDELERILVPRPSSVTPERAAAIVSRLADVPLDEETIPEPWRTHMHTMLEALELLATGIRELHGEVVAPPELELEAPAEDKRQLQLELVVGGVR